MSRRTGIEADTPGQARGAGRVGLSALPRPFRSLSVRLAALLSLALVPLGVIAFEQTRRLESELERVRDLNFHAITAEVARREAAATEQAVGAAQALSATLPALADDLNGCRSAVRSVVETSEGLFSFAGFLPRDGMLRCSSSGEAHDFSGGPDFEERMRAPRVFLTSQIRGDVSDAPVISVHHPARDAAGEFLGYVTVSLAARDIALPPGVTPSDVALAIVDETGTPLGSTLGGPGIPADAKDLLPEQFDPRDLSPMTGPTFADKDGSGQTRRYAVEPIVDGVAYAVGTRPLPAGAGSGFLATPAAYPVVMWVASLILVFGVIESSLMGPVRALGHRIRHFGRTRQVPDWPARRQRLPSELALIDETFADMTRRLAHDEGRLIDALHEQEVLLKEVHHRVKNNLQIISSMINLQVRNAAMPETEEALERINGRIASLATVHKRLYQSPSVGQVEFDSLLHDVVATLATTAIPEAPAQDRAPEIETALAPVRLTPDQSLPATMFAVEAVTNALKYARPDKAGRRWLRVCLEEKEPARADDGTDHRPEVALLIENSGRRPESDADEQEGRSGLGRRLIEGFARQLRGTCALGWEGDVFTARLAFRKHPFMAADATEPESRAGDTAGSRAT